MREIKVEAFNCEHCNALLLEKPKNNQCPACHKFVGKKSYGEIEEVVEEERGKHIKMVREKEYIVKILTNKYPCAKCLPDLQQECRQDLRNGFKIEFVRKNNTCVTK